VSGTRWYLIVAAILLVGLVAAAGVGSAVQTCLRAAPDCRGRVEAHLRVRVTPRVLPSRRWAAASFSGRMTISESEGLHPSALREAVLAIDKDVRVDATGLPTCGYRQLAGRDTKQVVRACRAAIVGKGTVAFSWERPENGRAYLDDLLPPPLLVIVNGGVQNGSIVLFAHAFVRIPTPQALIARIEIRHKRRSGWILRARIPEISAGQGSIAEVSLKLARKFSYNGHHGSFLSARCPDGLFKLQAPKLLFENDAGTPGVAGQTVLKGALTVPCTPRG
jgi:hypothetical protein